jgi:hypothetical protein
MPAFLKPTKTKSLPVTTLLIERSLAVALSLLCLILVFDRFGLAWDDGLQAFLGEHSLNFYLTLGADKSFLVLHNMASYGSVFETASALVHRLLGQEDIFMFRGLLIGLTAVAASFLTVRLATISGIGRFGWLAGLLLMTAPQFWGQAFINSKDIPFAAAYAAWWLSYILWFREGFRSDRWLIFSALSLGLVLGIRIAAIPLVGFTVCAGLTGWILQSRTEGLKWRDIVIKFPWKSHLFVLLIGWGFMTLIWPLALLNPVLNPIKAFQLFLSFPWAIEVFFAGEYYLSNDLPRHLFLVEQLLSHPLWCYPLYLLGICSLVERWRSRDPFQRFVCISLAFWILPLFLIFAISPFSSYNGVRHSLFLWPAFAWLSALGLHFLAGWFKQKGIASLWGFLIGGTAVLLNLTLLVSLHPFSYTYRNQTVSLFSGGANGFNTDYHAISYRLAAEWIDELALDYQSQNREPPSVLVWAPQHASLSYSYFVRSNQDARFTLSRPIEEFTDDFEYFVILHPYNRRPSLIDLFGLKQREMVHRIEEDGTLFCLVYR